MKKIPPLPPRAKAFAAALWARTLPHARPSVLAALAALAVLARIATVTDWENATPPPLGKAFYTLVIASIALRGLEALIARRLRRPASGEP